MGTEAGALGPQKHIFWENICVICFADLEYFLFEKEKEYWYIFLFESIVWLSSPPASHSILFGVALKCLRLLIAGWGVI